MNELIGVQVKRIYFHNPDFLRSEPLIESYLVDTVSGSCVKGTSSDSYLCANQEGANRSPSDKYPFLVVDESFSNLSSATKLLVFEVCTMTPRKKTQKFEKKRIAWAFLVPLASDGSTNVNRDLKLQLYEVRKDCKVSHQDCNVYHLYSDHKRKQLHGYLKISIKGVALVKSEPSSTELVQDNSTPAEKPRQPHQIVQTCSEIWKWSRLPSQTCRIPNRIHSEHNLGNDGITCFRFSRNGVYVASAALSRIVVNDVLSEARVIIFNSHIGFIYDLEWSFDDQQILSVSNDCRGAIWSLHQKAPLFILPHPSYVYCGTWFGNNHQVVTGGRDHTLRFWVKNEGGFALIEEILGHLGFISAIIAKDESLISGDSCGVIIIWKYTDGSFIRLRELSFPEIFKNAIDSIHFHTGGRRIVLSVRSRGSFLIDVESGIILHTYKSGLNALARLVSSLTPCGTMLFSFCQNGDVGVWEVNTGRLLASYGNLYPIDSLKSLSGCIRYHPYEHMVGIAALGRNCKLLLLKYDLLRKDGSEKLGLVFADKRVEDCSPRVLKLSSNE